jgi:peptidoglycan/LPS O-acetylase OafA/YrhL
MLAVPGDKAARGGGAHGRHASEPRLRLSLDFFRSGNGSASEAPYRDREKITPTSLTAPARNARDKIRCLDGLRGIACLIVFNYHFLWPWTPSIMLGYGANPPRAPEPYYDWSTLPIICLLHRGHPMVAIFFAISGYVLCRHILRAIHEKRYQAVYQGLASSVLRRPFRLLLPPTLSMLAVAVLAQLGIFRSEVSIYQGRDSAYINGTVTVNFRKINGTCNTNDTVPVNGTSELADYFTLYDWKTLHNKTDWPQVLCLNSSSVLFSPASLYGIPQDEEEKPKIPEKNTTIVINGTLYNMTYGPDRDPAPPRPVRLLRLPRGETTLVPTFEEDDLELDSKPVARDFIPPEPVKPETPVHQHEPEEEKQEKPEVPEKSESSDKPSESETSDKPDTPDIPEKTKELEEAPSSVAPAGPGTTLPATSHPFGPEKTEDKEKADKGKADKDKADKDKADKDEDEDEEDKDDEADPADPETTKFPKLLTHGPGTPFALLNLTGMGNFTLTNITNGTVLPLPAVEKKPPPKREEFLWVQLGGTWEEHPIMYESINYAFTNYTRMYIEWVNPFNYGHYHPRYDPHTFTIPMELRGSMFIYIFLLGTANIQAKWRLFFAAILSIYSIILGRWDMGAFIGGTMLSEIDIRLMSYGDNPQLDDEDLLPLVGNSSAERFQKPSRRTHIIRWSFFFLALYLLSYPDAGAEWTPGYIFLSSWVPRYYIPLSGWMFYHSMGALMLLPCVIRSPVLCRILESRVPQYLGKVSFSLYLVHGPILHCLGFWIMPRLFETFGRAIGYVIGWCFMLTVTLYAANWWHRKVDVWSTLLGKKIERLLVSREK